MCPCELCKLKLVVTGIERSDKENKACDSEVGQPVILGGESVENETKTYQIRKG